MEGTIGEIRMFAGNFAPRSWAYCAGQLLSIAQNDALFSILGTLYGGDGRTSFGLPDLRGRAAISAGQGPGLRFYREGQRSGTEEGLLNILSLASHTHTVTGDVSVDIRHPSVSDEANAEEPHGNAVATLDGVNAYASTFDGTMANDVSSAYSTLTTTNAGGSQYFDKMPPFLTMNYIICLYGIYPSRS